MSGPEAGERWARRLGGGATGLALVAALLWPLAATALEAARGERGAATAAGLIDAAAFGREAGLVAGPAAETLRVVGGSVLGALALGVPLAMGLFRTDLPGRRALRRAMALAVFVPMPLYAAGWLGGFGNAGYRQAIGSEPILRGWPGAAFVHAAAGVPWVALLVGVGLRSVEPELEESARLDLPAWRVATGVTLRRSLGAILGSALLVAALAGGDMTVTDILMVRTFAEEAYVQYGLGRPPRAVALVALPPTAALLALILVAARLVVGGEAERVASASRRPRDWSLGPWRWPAGASAWGVSGFLIAPPLAAMTWRAGRVGGDAARGEAPGWSLVGLRETLAYAWVEVREPLVQTGVVAALGATLAAALAWGLAWQCRRPGAWRWGVAGAVALMLALPGPVAGMALKLAYLHVPAVYDSAAIVALGYVVRGTPFALLVLWPAVRGVPEPLLDSARVDGRGPIGRLLHVALPMTRRGIAAAWLVAFVLAMGELPITNLVTPAGMESLTVFLWGQMHFGVDSRICGVGLVLVVAYATVGGAAVGAVRWAVGGRE